MITPGLCSISFRNYSADELIDYCADLKVPAIEWGGDLHVPHGDVAEAKRIKMLCDNRGIDCPSYGSYYRVGISEAQGLSFADVLLSAEILGCQTIRVWGGEKNYEDHSEAELAEAVKDTQRIADLASDKGIVIAFEYHGNSLTNNHITLATLDRAIDHPNVKYYWQPHKGYCHSDALSTIDALGEKMLFLHVFQWTLEDPSDEYSVVRHPLKDGFDQWLAYFQKAEEAGIERFAYMEFVLGDSLEQFKTDYLTLQSILAKL